MVQRGDLLTTMFNFVNLANCYLLENKVMIYDDDEKKEQCLQRKLLLLAMLFTQADTH